MGWTVATIKPVVSHVQCVRRHCSNPYGHMDGLIMFACYSDASDGQSSSVLVASQGHESSYS